MAVFCFTDIEGSTQLWERFPALMGDVIARHYAILQAAVAGNGGEIIKYTGDGLFAIFEGGRPLDFAVQAQNALAAADWGQVGELRERMGFHAGAAEKLTAGDYYGTTANRAARLLAAGWGGQVLLSADMKAASPTLPEGAWLEDLGTHLLKDLREPQQIYGLLHPSFKLKKFPSLKTLSSHPNNLPIQATPFLGREEELQEISQLLKNPACRLLTLLGPGGMGKTRLSLQAAAEQQEAFPQGIYFIALAGVSSPDLLVAATAEALSFNFRSRPGFSAGLGAAESGGQQGELEQLSAFLRDRQALLVFDNFEHLASGAGLCSELLKGAPKLKILATSRERLGLAEEWSLELKGMPLPEAGAGIDPEGVAAVQLFLGCARRSQPRFQPEDADLPAILELCRLVEGMPLGIELAAAWVRLLPVPEIAAAIRKNIDFLATTQKNVPERQRSLRAVFESSWALLSGEERQAFTRLSCFRSGFRAEAAAAVAGASLPLLAALADKSLIRGGGAGRYEVHEFLRQLAAERLQADKAEARRTRQAHGAYFCGWMAERRLELQGPKPREAFQKIDADLENVRGAWNWAVIELNAPALDQAMEGLSIYHFTRGLSAEGEELFRLAAEALAAGLEQAGPPGQKVLAKLLARRGVFCERQGRKSKGRSYVEQGLAILRELGAREELGFCLNHLGNMSELGQREAYFNESLAVARELRDPIGTAWALQKQGHLAGWKGDMASSRDRMREALAAYRQCGHRIGQSYSLWGLAVSEHWLGELDASDGFAREALAIFEEIGSREGRWLSKQCLAQNADARGDYPSALAFFQETLAIQRDLGDRHAAAWCLGQVARIAAKLGDKARAALLFQESLETRQQIGDIAGMLRDLSALIELARGLGKFGEVRALLSQILGLMRAAADPAVLGEGLSLAAQFAADDTGTAEARALAEAGLELAKARGDAEARGQALSVLASLAAEARELSLASQLCGDSLAAFAEAGREGAKAWPLEVHARVCLARGEAAKAEDFLHAALALHQAAPNPPPARLAGVLDLLGQARSAQGDWPGARDRLLKALDAAWAARLEPATLSALVSLAAVLAWQGRGGQGVELLSFCLAQAACAGGQRRRAQGLLAEIAAALPSAEVSASREAGSRRSLEALVQGLLNADFAEARS